jgi:hypothetical protein
MKTGNREREVSQRKTEVGGQIRLRDASARQESDPPSLYFRLRSTSARQVGTTRARGRKSDFRNLSSDLRPDLRPPLLNSLTHKLFNSNEVPALANPCHRGIPHPSTLDPRPFRNPLIYNCGCSRLQRVAGGGILPAGCRQHVVERRFPIGFACRSIARGGVCGGFANRRSFAPLGRGGIWGLGPKASLALRAQPWALISRAFGPVLRLAHMGRHDF